MAQADAPVATAVRRSVPATRGLDGGRGSGNRPRPNCFERSIRLAGQADHRSTGLPSAGRSLAIGSCCDPGPYRVVTNARPLSRKAVAGRCEHPSAIYDPPQRVIPRRCRTLTVRVPHERAMNGRLREPCRAVSLRRCMAWSPVVLNAHSATESQALRQASRRPDWHLTPLVDESSAVGGALRARGMG